MSEFLRIQLRGTRWFQPFDLHEVVEEGRTAAEIGESRWRCGIAVAIPKAVFVPPDAWRNNDARANRFTDDCTSGERTAIVENVDQLAMLNSAMSRVVGTDFQLRFNG